MKRVMLLIVCVWGLAVGASRAADFLRPVDPGRQAEIDGMDIDAGDLDLRSIPQPTRSTPVVTDAGKKAPTSDVTLSETTLRTVRFNSVTLTDVPRQNFSAKRAQANDQVRRDREVAKANARITDRQIRPHTPAGEQELKDQLNLRY